MKKIININLSGRVIPIEDTAYDLLQAYIESLRRYFANEESREEIINDIESRIAELLQEKTRRGAHAVQDADVEEVIASMGTVADFEAQEKEETTASANNTTAGSSNEQTAPNFTTSGKKSRGRLYRDSNDKFIGGVCSGIAAYLNVDPAVVRLITAIIGFGTGIGFVAYIILWIVLPPKDLEGFSGKRLYRNPDDRILGGVAGGLAAYFDKRANNIRLLFAAPILLQVLINILSGFRWNNDFDLAINIGFGSFTSVFVLTYVILWIVLPEANTEYEKMEMRGEKVDVNRIRQNVKQGMGNVKDRLKDWSNEVQDSANRMNEKAKQFAANSGRFASDVNETVRRSSNGLGHAIVVIVKVFFLFIAGVMSLAIFSVLIAMLFGGISWWPINGYLWTSNYQQFLAWGTLFFFFLVPMIGFIIWIIRRIIRVKSKNNYLGWAFGGMWVIGWICATVFAASMIKDFREYETIATEVNITQPVNNKLILTVSEGGIRNSSGFGWMGGRNNGWDMNADSMKIGAVNFSVNSSTDGKYHVYLKKYSFGRTVSEARDRAGNIRYAVHSADSVLDLGNGYVIDSKSKFRVQHVEIALLVPVGKSIRFDASLVEILSNNFSVRVKKNRHNNITDIDIDTDHEEFFYRPNVDYVMTETGILKDPNEKETINQPASTDYRYPDTDVKEDKYLYPDSVINVELDKEKKRLDELDKESKERKDRIKRLEEQKKTPKPGDVIKSNNPVITINQESIAIAPSPLSSMVEWF